MNLKYKAAVLVAGLAVGATPALAVANGSTHANTTSTSASSKAKKYGKLCQGTPKKKLAGAKRTQFSLCVTALSHLANGSAKNPTAACKALSHKKSKGIKGHSPFSACVIAAAKLHKSENGGTGTGTTTSSTNTSTSTSTTG